MASSAASLWYGNYKGAVYPVDLHAAPTSLNLRVQGVKTLVDLAAEKIVQDSEMTRVALSMIPSHLCEPLMKEALFKNRELSIRYIIGSWPSVALKLSHMVPHLFTSLQPLYNNRYLGDIVKQGLRYTTSLAHTYLEALKTNSPTKLRYLDLTGFPTAEVIVYFLSAHCMLAHNEVRHETIRSMYEQALQQSGREELSIPVKPMEPMEHSLPQDCSVIIKLDAFVTSESTHSELCKALTVSTFNNRKLSIVVGRLAMTCLGQARISLLLRQLHSEHLTGLQLQYNALTGQDFVRLVPALKTLVCLESLDLSCNSIFFYSHEAACSAAAQVFEVMPRLHRLDLSNNRIKTRLRRLLDSIVRPLTFLRLAGCSLTVTDLTYLAHSIHRSKLIELDLSENNLTLCDQQLQNILTASQASLCVLELEDCNLNDSNLHSLLPPLSRLSSLMFFNISQNQVAQTCLMSLLTSMADLLSLQVFKTSYAIDCYDFEGEEDRLKASALSELKRVVINSKVESERLKPLMLFMTELERVLETV